MLPNAPLDTKWLTPEERLLAHNRILRDTTQKKDKVSIWKGLREACTDYRTWIFALMQNLHLSANGFKVSFSFQPQLEAEVIADITNRIFFQR